MLTSEGVTPSMPLANDTATVPAVAPVWMMTIVVPMFGALLKFAVSAVVPPTVTFCALLWISADGVSAVSGMTWPSSERDGVVGESAAGYIAAAGGVEQRRRRDCETEVTLG